MVGIKFADKVVPFPDEPGVFIRLCFKGNNIVQGHVLLFPPTEPQAIDLANGNVTTPEVLMDGDKLCNKDNVLVTYTKVVGVKIKREADRRGEQGNGVPPPPQPPLGS